MRWLDHRRSSTRRQYRHTIDHVRYNFPFAFSNYMLPSSTLSGILQDIGRCITGCTKCRIPCVNGDWNYRGENGNCTIAPPVDSVGGGSKIAISHWPLVHSSMTPPCQISSRSVYSGGEKKTNFAVFWNSAFCGVATWQQSENVEHVCTTKNLPLSNGIKIVFVLHRLPGETGRTCSDVEQRDGQTDIQTDKKTQRFWPPRRRVKSDPLQTCQGFCTSKTFGVQRIVLSLGSLKIWAGNATPST